MRYTTARRAWHDAFYTGKENTLDQRLMLGVSVQKTVRSNSVNTACHIFMAGMIQNAIATLRFPLQCFGNYLYRSFSESFSDIADYAEAKEVAQEAIKNGILLLHINEQWTDAKFERVHYLIFACMEDYKKTVNSGNDKFRSYKQLCQWIYDEYGIKIDHTHWHRDWMVLYKEILNICNDFDRRALKPVTEVIVNSRKAA